MLAKITLFKKKEKGKKDTLKFQAKIRIKDSNGSIVCF